MSRARVLRLALLAAVVVAIVVVRHTTRVGASLSTAHLREVVQHAGITGVGVFMAAFAAGELLHIPGLVFVGAAVLAWGRLTGGALAYIGALVAVSLAFVVVRTIGGQPLGELTSPRIRALMQRLERQPVRTVAVLRLLLWMAPALTYALALSRVRYRDYAAGSAIGLFFPIAAAAALFELYLH